MISGIALHVCIWDLPHLVSHRGTNVFTGILTANITERD